MKKKIKDLTIQDMIKICLHNKNKCISCYDCVLFNICSETPYYINFKNDNDNVDLNVEIDLLC